MDLAQTSWLFFRTHLVRVAWSRRSLLCGLLASLPVVCAFLIGRFGHTSPSELATNIGFVLQLQVLVPVLALVAGSAAVAEEVEDRTITFLFSRPIPRASLLLGRWAAILVYLLALLALSSWALMAVCELAQGKGVDLSDGIRTPLIVCVLIGGAVYSALFAALGAFTRHPVIVGLAYAFAIEGFLANLTSGLQSLTIQYHLRSLLATHGSPVWREVEAFTATSFASTAGALWTLGGVLVVALGLGCWRLTRREFVLSA